jgi:hypothetical protein
MWFSKEQLPLAFGMLLFLVKSVRSLNDNIAPLIYNKYNDLTEFFWFGLIVCIFSFVVAIILTYIH